MYQCASNTRRMNPIRAFHPSSSKTAPIFHHWKLRRIPRRNNSPHHDYAQRARRCWNHPSRPDRFHPSTRKRNLVHWPYTARQESAHWDWTSSSATTNGRHRTSCWQVKAADKQTDRTTNSSGCRDRAEGRRANHCRCGSLTSWHIFHCPLKRDRSSNCQLW